jgi:hypothetical protein
MDFQIKNAMVCLCAKRKSGKSELLRYLVHKNRDSWCKIFIVCPSEGVNKFYSDFVPSNCIFDKYSEDWVEKLIIEMGKINSGKSSEDAKHILLILDDCCSDVKFHQSDSLKKLFTRGRHVKISVIITSQYLYQLPPVARNNADYLLVSQMNKQGLDVLCNDFLMGNISKEKFIDCYYRNTSNYGFLVISNNASSDNNNLDEIYGQIKCPEWFLKNK